MNAYQNKNVFPVARRNDCHNIKPQVYVHILQVFQCYKTNTT